MNKNYKRPELEVKSFGLKENILGSDLFSQPEYDDEWDTGNTNGTEGTK